jgi:hypothetical protein
MSRLPFALVLLLVPGCPGSAATDAGADSPVIDAPRTDATAIDAPGADTPTLVDAPAVDAPTTDAPVDCTAQDARGEGACDLVLGVAWLGSYCGTLSGCSCVGADCGALYADLTTCGQAHRSCPRVCGGLTPTGSPTCLADEFCDWASSEMCGATDAPGDCAPRPSDCPEPGGVPVCGCDGMEYLNECLANLAGTDAAVVGGCP